MPSTESVPLPAGTRVGPFQLLEVLDTDRGTTLYRAIRPEGTREPRVVEVRAADNPKDERTSARIRYEYNVLRALDDPHIPKAFGFYASHCAIAMSHVDGVTLADIIGLSKEGRVLIDQATAIDIVVEIAHSARHAHAVVGPKGGIVHTHLSSSRVRLTSTGAVTLMGFGQIPPGTHAGYTPPEQAAGAFLDSRSDQWSLGAIAVELLCGERLYTGSRDRKADALNGRVGPWIEKVERSSPSMARVLVRMLAPAAGDRYEREADLLRELLSAQREAGGRPDRLALTSRALHILAPPPEPEIETGQAAEDDDLPTQMLRSEGLPLRVPRPSGEPMSAPIQWVEPQPMVSPPLGFPEADPTVSADLPAPAPIRPRRSEPVRINAVEPEAPRGRPLPPPPYADPPTFASFAPPDPEPSSHRWATRDELPAIPELMPADEEPPPSEQSPAPAPPPSLRPRPTRPAEAASLPPQAAEGALPALSPSDRLRDQMMQMQARLSEGLPDFLPAEVAGMVMGALLLLVGLTFLFWRFG